METLFIASMLAFLLLIIGISVYLVYWLAVQLKPYRFGGGPYVPTPQDRVDKMVEIARLTRDDVAVDLGSGDGRLIFSAVEGGAGEGIGYEIYGRLVRKANERARQLGITDRARFEEKSFWDVDISRANVVFLFQLPMTMKRIVRKLEAELKPGTRVVSYSFLLPGWEIADKRGDVYLYVKE